MSRRRAGASGSLGTAPLILDCRAGHDDPAGGVARYIGRASPTVVAAVLVGIAGVSGYP